MPTDLPEFLTKNYERLREERDLSWQQMAEQFRKRGQDELERWAKSRANARKSTRTASKRETR